MFLPPHSCELNPIEKVWNVIKNQWRRESYLVLKDFSNTVLLIQQALFKIQSLADEANQEVMKRVAQSNYKTMSISLRGCIV